MDSNRLRVLIIDNSLGKTGAFKSIFSNANFLKEIDFHFAIPSRLNIDVIREAGHNSFFVNYIEIQKNWKLLIYLPKLLLNTIAILRYMKHEGIKILHINDLYNMTGVLAKILWPELKLIYHIRLLPTSYVGRMYKIWVSLICRFADDIICVSRAVSEHIPCEGKRRIIYDSVGHTKIADAFCNRGKKVLCLYPANYINGKGHKQAIEAFELAFKKNKNLRLRFVGGDLGQKKNKAYKASLIKKVKSIELDKIIEFGDFSSDINLEISKSDMVLVFSESESFSMVCLEAGLLGKPVISSKSGGPQEIIIDGETGFLVDNRDIIQMADKILELGSSYSLREDLGKKAIVDYAKRFSIEKSSNMLHEVYKSI